MPGIAIHLVVTDADAAAGWYADVLDAVEVSRLALPSGRTLTVQLEIGDTAVAVAAAVPGTRLRTPVDLGGTPSAFHLRVQDVDGYLERAVEAGATVFEPVHDAVWGDRTGQFLDPSGHRWAVTRHDRDVPEEEVVAALAHMLGDGD